MLLKILFRLTINLKILNKTKDLIKLIRSFVYAASSTATFNTPIGHNKVINEFARNHRDLVENWEELPEIILTSSEKRQGLDVLMSSIKNIIPYMRLNFNIKTLYIYGSNVYDRRRPTEIQR